MERDIAIDILRHIRNVEDELSELTYLSDRMSDPEEKRWLRRHLARCIIAGIELADEITAEFPDLEPMIDPNARPRTSRVCRLKPQG